MTRSTERGLGRRRRPPSATTERISTLTSSPPRSRSPTLTTPLPPRSRLSTLTPSPSRSRSSTLTPLTQAGDRRPRGRGGGTKSWSLPVKEEGGGEAALHFQGLHSEKYFLCQKQLDTVQLRSIMCGFSFTFPK